MSEKKKVSDYASDTKAAGDFFDSMIADFSSPDTAEDKKALTMKDFSEFFNDAAASGKGFESTIDSSGIDVSGDTRTLRFNGPVTDENGMIVIYDEEAGINAVDSADELLAAMESARVSAEKQNGSAPKPEEQESEHSETKAESDSESSSTDAANDFSEASAEKEIVSEITESKNDDPEANGSSPEHKEKNQEEKNGFLAGLFPKKGDSVGEIIRKFLFLAALVVFIAAGFMLISTLVQSEQAVQEQDDIMSVYESIVSTTIQTTINDEGVIVTVPPQVTLSHEERMENNFNIIEYYQSISEDYVGFLEIPGCNIMYPVVQGTDNEYYLTHTFTGRQNKAGSLFLDYRCTVTEEENSPNLVIYGHNQEDGTMFGRLKLYKDNCSFYKYNPFVSFSTKYDVYDYVIFGYFVTNATPENDINGEVFHYHDYIDELSDEAAFNWYMQEIAKRNQIISPVDVQFGDELLVLSTCSSDFSDSRFVVFARKLRSGENKYRFDFKSVEMNPNAKLTDMEEALSQSLSVSASLSESEAEASSIADEFASTSILWETVIPESFEIVTEPVTVATQPPSSEAQTVSPSSISLATQVNAEESRHIAESSRAQSILDSLASVTTVTETTEETTYDESSTEGDADSEYEPSDTTTAATTKGLVQPGNVRPN